jgi:cytochrome c553
MSIKQTGRRGLALRGAIIGLALGVLPLSASAAPTERAHLARLVKAAPAEQQAAREAGRKAAFFCANCHGEGGLSKYGEVPNLAGQNPVYVLNQIEAFLIGKRKDAFMQGLMKVLSAEEKANIALFYAAQPVTPAMADAGPRGAEGREHFMRNCFRCHGADARGGESFPRLAGQQPEYLRRNLTRYLKNAPERIYPPMTAAVTVLGEKNVESVVAYLSSLK